MFSTVIFLYDSGSKTSPDISSGEHKIIQKEERIIIHGVRSIAQFIIQIP